MHSRTAAAAAAAAGFASAKIVQVTSIAKNVKRLDLVINSTAPPFTFLPGQWCDFYIESIDEVSGYSMISSPLELPCFSLAVQQSKSKAALHIHNEMKENDQLWVRSGGNVFWDGSDHKNALMLAGGIGVTPYMSMVNHLAMSKAIQKTSNFCALVHSSKNNVLVNELQDISNTLDSFYYQHSVTNGSGSGRINLNDIERALRSIKNQGTVIPMICGSEPFLKNMELMLIESFDFQENEIMMEKWW
jgi:benzoate/toluate 1,2-dioxygenase reductase subunit